MRIPSHFDIRFRGPRAVSMDEQGSSRQGDFHRIHYDRLEALVPPVSGMVFRIHLRDTRQKNRSLITNSAWARPHREARRPKVCELPPAQPRGRRLGVCHKKLDALRKQAQASRRPGLHLVGIIPTSSGSRKKMVAVFRPRQGRRRIVSQSFGTEAWRTSRPTVTDRRERYRNRHRKDLDTADPVRADF